MLRSGGHYLLVSFDRLDLNPAPKAAGDAVDALFPDDPLQYMERGPFSYADPALIEDDRVAAGFTDVELETVALSSRVSAADAAQGMALGSPFRSEIERRDPAALDRAGSSGPDSTTRTYGLFALLSFAVFAAAT